MVKKWFIVVLFAILLTACTKEPIIPIEEDEEEHIHRLEKETLSGEYVFWHGRNHYQNERQYFYYTATGFIVEVYGRIIEIDFSLEEKDTDIYYRVAKDNEDLMDALLWSQKNSHDTLTVTFDTYDYHRLEVVKVSEPEDGITSISKISTNGYFIKPEVSYQAHFLIMGASGISGHGALGNPGVPRTTLNSSSLHSFGYLTAKHYGGSFEFVSSSGWGLAFGFNDKTGEENIYKAYLNMGILPNRKVLEVPYEQVITPDVIIINVGGNDYSAVINPLNGFAKQEKIQEFKDQVAAFVLKLRADAPNAHIIWTMTSGSLNGNAALQVFSLLDVKDKPYVHMVVIEDIGAYGDPAGANNHASYQTHQKSTQNIIDLIETLDIDKLKQ